MAIKTFLKKNCVSSGFSLAEMLVYVALMSLILLAVINIVFSFTRAYEQLGALRAVEHSGLISMERMIRDTHSATAVNLAQSVFGTSTGALAISIGTTTTRFYVSNGELRVSIGGIDIGPLSSANAEVTGLIFRHIITAESEAVRIEMTVRGTAGSSVREKTFRSTAILKNS